MDTKIRKYQEKVTEVTSAESPVRFWNIAIVCSKTWIKETLLWIEKIEHGFPVFCFHRASHMLGYHPRIKTRCFHLGKGSLILIFIIQGTLYCGPGAVQKVDASRIYSIGVT